MRARVSFSLSLSLSLSLERNITAFVCGSRYLVAENLLEQNHSQSQRAGPSQHIYSASTPSHLDTIPIPLSRVVTALQTPLARSFSTPLSSLLRRDPSSSAQPPNRPSVVPSARAINQGCQFVMAILCVHLSGWVQTVHPSPFSVYSRASAISLSPSLFPRYLTSYIQPTLLENERERERE